MAFEYRTATTSQDVVSSRTAAEAEAHKEASTGTRTRDRSISLPAGAIIRNAYVTVTVNGNAATANNCESCAVNGQQVRSGGSNSPATYEIPISITSGTTIVHIDLEYRLNRYTSATRYTVTFEELGVVIVYDLGEQEYIDNEVLIPEKAVMLYDAKETDFTKNGIMLHPTSCEVTEEAGGEYELSMEHPRDPEGRWRALLEDKIIKAPVPPYKIPPTQMPPWKTLQTNKATKLYSVLPTYASAKNADVEKVRADPDSYAWISGTYYTAGRYVTRNGKIYQAKRGTVGQHPPEYPDAWAYVDTVATGSSSGGSGQYNPGKIIATIPNATTISKIADYNGTWIRVQYGVKIGYIRKTDCAETGESSSTTYPGRTIYTQLFRIYEVSSDDAEQTVTVSARHISYDLQKNCLFDCQLSEATPATAIAYIQASMINADERTIVCDMSWPRINANWSFQNPVQALLDPEEGLAGQVKAKVLRDNADFFILDNTCPRRGIRLAYGNNLTGVTWTRNMDDLVTRVIPRAKDANGNYIYLAELFVDSPHINDYAVISTEVLDSEYSVGQKIKRADGSEQTLTRQNVQDRMKTEAQNRFDNDGADKVTVSLDVEFMLLGDTEEYRQYRNLQRVNLYDRITIDSSGIETTAQVSGYTWDCLRARYSSISIGKVYSMARKHVPGYRLAAGSVSYSKLSPDLMSYIKGAT